MLTGVERKNDKRKSKSQRRKKKKQETNDGEEIPAAQREERNVFAHCIFSFLTQERIQ